MRLLQTFVRMAAALAALSFHPAMADAQTPAERGRALEQREIFFDQWGLIVHKDPTGSFNGGDTLQREGWFWLGVALRARLKGVQPFDVTRPPCAGAPGRPCSFDDVIKLVEPNGDGVFYRHPKQEPYSNPFDKKWGTSRDQLVPMIAALGAWGKPDVLRRLWDALPESQLGKHAFNGNYRTLLGQDAPNCMDIKRRDCSPQGDCSLQVDNRPCDLQVDNRDCSRQVDTRDCSLKEDTRSCVIGSALGKEIRDPTCEGAKGAQNDLYRLQKAACETAKATQNAAYATRKAQCETEKATQNSLYNSAKAACETAKTAQNAIYAADKASCEGGKTARKLGCETDKAAAYQVCRLANVHSGDIIGPQTINLFRRAIGENPLNPVSSLSGFTLLQALNVAGAAGEAELLANAEISVHPKGRDDVDDLNHIVHLLIAKLHWPTPVSDQAAAVYYLKRPHSYGSYLGPYYAKFGDDFTGSMTRIDDGISAGWKPDVSAAYGTTRWYHRADTGANPRLAILYQPIIEAYLKPTLVDLVPK